MPISTYLKTNLEVINHLDLEHQSVILNRDSGLLNATKKVSRLINFIRWCISRITCRHFPQNPQLDEATRLIIDEIGREIQAKAGITSEEKTALSDSLKKLHIISKKNGGKDSKLEAMLVKVEAIIPVQILVPKIPINENKNLDVPKFEDPVKTKDPILEPKDVINQAHGKEEEKGSIQISQDQSRGSKNVDNENIETVKEDCRKEEKQPIDAQNDKKEPLNVEVIQEVKENKKLTKDELLLAIKLRDPFNEEDIKPFRHDKDFFLEACARKHEPFRYANDELKSDVEFINNLARLNGLIIQYCDQKFLEEHEDIVLVAIKNDPDVYDLLTKPTEKAALEAVTKNSSKFRSTQRHFPNNKEIALVVVKEGLDTHIHKIELSETLQNDKDFFRNATEEAPHALLYASHALQKDPNLIKELIEIEGHVVDFVDEEFRTDENFMLAIHSKKSAPDIIISIHNPSRELVVEAARKTGEAYGWIQQESDLRKDEEIALLALGDKDWDGEAYRQLHPNLKESFDFMLKAVKANPKIKTYMKNSNILEQKELLKRIKEELKPNK